MIGIRVDANQNIATGHLMRCLSIADKLVLRGEKVLFIVSNDTNTDIIQKKSYEYYRLSYAWNHVKEEIEEVINLIEVYNIDTMLVDSYVVDNEYYEGLRKHCKIVCFDDFFSETYNVDMLVNYNAFHYIYDYEGRYSNVKCLLGEKYIPLRDEFSQFKKEKMSEKIKVIMLSGGGDKNNCLGRQLNSYISREGFDEFQFVVISGILNDNYTMLKELDRDHSNISVLYNVTNMAEVMSECDMAISAASTVLYELCAVGVPTIFFESSWDQVNDRQFFEKNDIMIYAGNIIDECDQCIDNIWESLIKLRRDSHLWNKYHDNMKSIVDGKGASRIADEIIKL